MKRSELKQLIREVIEEGINPDYKIEVLKVISDLWEDFYYDKADDIDVDDYISDEFDADRWEESTFEAFWSQDIEPQDAALNQLGIELSDDEWNELESWLQEQPFDVNWYGKKDVPGDTGLHGWLKDQATELAGDRRYGHPSLSTAERNR